MTPLAYLKLGVAVLVLTILATTAAWYTHHEREIGRAEVQAKWDAERVALQAQVQAQKDRNIDLQRASELRYTVVAAAQDRFIVQTITEIRHETDNLAACVLTPAAAQRLRDAARCARGDSAAACGPDQPVRASP